MKKILFSLIFFFPLFLIADEAAILQEIRLLREDTNKRFEQMERRFEQIDQRLAQTDQKIEQNQKHIEYIQTITSIILAAVFASPFIVSYFSRKEQQETTRLREQMQQFNFALRELAQDDPKVERSLKTAGLL